MKSQEEFVSGNSEYFIYSPSRTALDVFLYPLQCGHFLYEPGYFLKRDSYNSFLLMYIQKGEMELEIKAPTASCGNFDPLPAGKVRRYHARSNSFILLDCYESHAYSSATGCECLWCHYDGITARNYYDIITSRMGNIFVMPDPYPALSKLTSVYNVFHTGAVVREPLLSKYLNDIMTEFMLYLPDRKNARGYSNAAEEAITYINEHFAEEISVSDLAARAGLSHYYFIRTFKKETGFTPHEYILNTRIATAQYLLKNTKLTVKDICYQTGFSCESIFCSAFKRQAGMTPTQYRTSD